MRLARLEMLGFKSFMNKADLRFEDGITSILGPNGCGKSNIVDAVRWVLGEQSAKLLRGVKMENVIFQGTQNRAPMGVCEVTLTFTGAAETLPVDYDEISVKRRVTRGGGSEYFLNGQPQRLRDINDLLAGSGIGDHAYAIIEQDMVKSLLADNGDKRRILFEEAAGIMKYKLRRKESLSKLQSVDGDLTRLDDILDELGKTVRSLKYQMGRARSYRRFQEQMRAAELFHASVELHGMWTRDRGLDARLTGLDDETRGEESRLAVLEEEISRLETEMLAEERAYQEGRNELESEAAVLRKREEEMAVLEEKARAEKRRQEGFRQEERLAAEALERLAAGEQQLAAERRELEESRRELAVRLAENEAALRERAETYQAKRRSLDEQKQLRLDFVRSRAEAGGEHERLAERLAQTRETLASLEEEDERLKEQERSLAAELEAQRELLERAEALSRERHGEEAAGREALAALESSLEEKRRERSALDLRAGELGARRELLERLQEERAGYPEGTRRLLESRQGESALLGLFAEGLRVDEERRPLLELALGEALGGVLVSDRQAALPWLEALRQDGAGRVVVLESASESAGAEAIEGLEPLAAWLDARGEAAPVLSRLLARHYLAPDAAAALEASRRHPGITVLSPEGFLAREGLLEGGSAAGDLPLGRAEELEALAAEIEALAPRRQSLEAERAELDARLESGRAALEDTLRGIQVAEEDLSARRMEKTRLDTRLGRMREEREGLRSELKMRRRQEQSLVEALAEAERRLAELSGVEAPPSEDLGGLEREVASLESERDALQETLAERRLEKAALEGRLENLRLREENRLREVSGEEDRKRRAAEGQEESGRAAREAAERALSLREGLGPEQDRLEEKRRESDRRLEAINERREELRGRQSATRALRERRRESEQARHGLEMERNTLSVRMESLRQAMREKYDAEMDPSRDPAESGQAPQLPEGRSLEEHLADLRKKLERLGNVNLMALEEFEEKNERYQFLLAQKDDLVQAKQGLMETIQRINQEARQRFDETFKVVRRNFMEIFQAVFEGGDADLSYTTDEDPLDAAIQVTARPKEKRIADISQLSSGEKTLTALSILFAIYLAKPSPFCIFDEVDAPLDDANIARFLRLLRQFSERTQFILITHNKKTMEVARHLYGVTMEESGVSKLVSVAFDEVPDDLEKEPLVAGRGA